MGSYLDELKVQMGEKKPENITVPTTEAKPETKTIDLNELRKSKEDKQESKVDSLKDLFHSTAPLPEMETKPIAQMLGKKEEIKEIDSLLASWETSGKLVTKYDDIEIYRLENDPLLYYKANIPKSSPSQKMIINTLKEATTRLITTDPYKIRDPIQRQNIYYQKILEILENAPEINVPKHLFSFYAKAVVTEMVGFGIIEPLIHDTKLEEIMVIGPNRPTYVYHRDYGMMYSNVVFYSDGEIQDLIDKIARILGRRVDISSPLLDARLPDGSRVNATIPPASIDGSTVTIRKFREDPYTIVDLINFKTINLEVAAFLWSAVNGFGAKPANIIIAGGTGSGKTSLLNVLASFIPDDSRVITIEDTAELKLPIKHTIRFEGKPPGMEGTGELTLEVLVKNTLRMRPDRVIVGEIRSTEASVLFTAMNTGHDGCMGTIHANSARETLVRITSPPMDVPMLMLAGLDLIIVQKILNTAQGKVRRITEIAEVEGVYENDPKVNIIFRWNPQTDNLERTENPIKYFEIIKTHTKNTDKDIADILTKKIKLLNELVSKNIRDINDVSKKIQEMYVKDKNWWIMSDDNSNLKNLKKDFNKEKSTVDFDAVQNIVKKLKDKDKAKGVTGPVTEGHLKELRDIIAEGKLAKLNIDTEAKLLSNSNSSLDKSAVKIYSKTHGFINEIVKNLVRNNIGKKIAFYLYSANSKKSLIQHLVLSTIYSLLVTAFITVLVGVILFFVNPLFLVLIPIILGFVFIIALLSFSYLVPMSQAKQRGILIDTELPYALRHISTELQAGIGLYKTLQSVAKNDYGVLSEEMSRTIIEIENGTDTKTALRHMALRSQSKNLNTAIFHIVRTLNTGGNLSQSIDSVADTVSFDLMESAKQFGEKMNFFGIIFIFVAIVLPVFLAILSAIANAPIGQGGDLFMPGILTPTLLTVVYLLVMPAIFIFIAYYIKLIEPKI